MLGSSARLLDLDSSNFFSRFLSERTSASVDAAFASAACLPLRSDAAVAFALRAGEDAASSAVCDGVRISFGVRFRSRNKWQLINC